MNAYLVCILLALPADPGPGNSPSLYRPSPELEAAFRGQAPSYDQDPVQSNGYSTLPPPTYAAPTYPNAGGWLAPFQPGQMLADPFGGFGGQAAPEMAGAYPGGPMFGANAPKPYRFGWTIRGDVGWLPRTSVSDGGNGKFGIFELNTDFRHRAPLAAGWILSLAQQLDLRTWDGPKAPDLGGTVYRLGWDLELATPGNAPWSVQLGFNPSLNTDFEKSLDREAWNLDGRGILFFRASPQWLWALGAGFWDRVHDKVIPYAGVVWTPDDRWEFRILFPESQVSYFLGCWGNLPCWIYATAEYHVEAYQIRTDHGSRDREQIQLEDWRVMIGLRKEHGGILAFIEGGWVLGREVRFRYDTASDFNIADGGMIRAGLRF